MELDREGEKIMVAAQIGYEAYCNYTGWKSAVTGAPLPPWSNLPGGVANAWFATAKAITSDKENDDLRKLISNFDAAIRMIATELTGEACCGVDTEDEINQETGKPYGPGGHTGWLLAAEARKLKQRIAELTPNAAVHGRGHDSKE